MSMPDTLLNYEVRDAGEKADMLLMKADLTAESDTLTLTFTTPEYMEKDVAGKLEPYIRRPITYVWKEGQFVIEE